MYCNYLGFLIPAPTDLDYRIDITITVLHCDDKMTDIDCLEYHLAQSKFSKPLG